MGRDLWARCPDSEAHLWTGRGSAFGFRRTSSKQRSAVEPCFLGPPKRARCGLERMAPCSAEIPVFEGYLSICAIIVTAVRRNPGLLGSMHAIDGHRPQALMGGASWQSQQHTHRLWPSAVLGSELELCPAEDWHLQASRIFCIHCIFHSSNMPEPFDTRFFVVSVLFCCGLMQPSVFCASRGPS